MDARLIVQFSEQQAFELLTRTWVLSGGFQDFREVLRALYAPVDRTVVLNTWVHLDRFKRQRDDYRDGGWQGFLRTLSVVLVRDGVRCDEWSTIAAWIEAQRGPQETDLLF